MHRRRALRRSLPPIIGAALTSASMPATSAAHTLRRHPPSSARLTCSSRWTLQPSTRPAGKASTRSVFSAACRRATTGNSVRPCSGSRAISIICISMAPPTAAASGIPGEAPAIPAADSASINLSSAPTSTPTGCSRCGRASALPPTTGYFTRPAVLPSPSCRDNFCSPTAMPTAPCSEPRRKLMSMHGAPATSSAAVSKPRSRTGCGSRRNTPTSISAPCGA